MGFWMGPQCSVAGGSGFLVELPDAGRTAAQLESLCCRRGRKAFRFTENRDRPGQAGDDKQVRKPHNTEVKDR